jgi:hypothetical protein
MTGRATTATGTRAHADLAGFFEPGLRVMYVDGVFAGKFGWLQQRLDAGAAGDMWAVKLDGRHELIASPSGHLQAAPRSSYSTTKDNHSDDATGYSEAG